MLRSLDQAALRAFLSLGRRPSEGGQTVVEYGLIASLIAVAILVAALLLFQEELAALFNAVADCLSGGSC